MSMDMYECKIVFEHTHTKSLFLLSVYAGSILEAVELATEYANSNMISLFSLDDISFLTLEISLGCSIDAGVVSCERIGG